MREAMSAELLEIFNRVTEPLRWSIQVGPLHFWRYDAPTAGQLWLWRWGIRIGTCGVTVLR